MHPRRNNFAFVDSQNVYLGIRALGWDLDFARFRRYLADKYGVAQAFLFIGYLPGNGSLYTRLQSAGFICVFKPTLELPDGTVKGNVDAELVLHTMIEYQNFDKALIISGDGDFYCLIEYLKKQDKLLKVLVPDQRCYSSLLKQLSSPSQNIFDFMNPLKDKIGRISRK